jgi:hypothetical protein
LGKEREGVQVGPWAGPWVRRVQKGRWCKAQGPARFKKKREGKERGRAVVMLMVSTCYVKNNKQGEEKVYGGVEPVLLEHEQVLQDFVENYKSR